MSFNPGLYPRSKVRKRIDSDTSKSVHRTCEM